MSSFKRGATFTAIYTVETVQVDGVTVADLTGWTARCKLRDAKDNLIEELTATIIDPVARKARLSSAGTSGWPKGKVLGDVWFIGPGGAPVVPTPTFSFDVSDGPSR
jgi:hypothetical protein